MEPNTQDMRRNQYMLTKGFAKQGYDWWWHSFTGHNAKTGEEKAFFIEYFLCNPALGEDKPVLGQLPENKAAGKKPSYLMVKAGCWGNNARQLHRFFGWNEIEVGTDTPFWISADDCFATETNLTGSIKITDEDARNHPEWMCDAGTMIWDVELDKQIAFNVGYGASTPMREAQGFEMYWHAQGIKTLVSGNVWLDGVKYVIEPETSYGYSDKNWGSNFTTPWVWLSSWDLTSNITGKRLENSAFDIGGGKPKVFNISLPQKLLGCFIYEGEQFEFNFSKPWTGSETRFRCGETITSVVWHVEQETTSHLMITDIICQKRDMLKINYESPDGMKRHNNLWNGGNGRGTIKLYKKVEDGTELIDEITANHVGCEYGEYDEESI